MVQHILVAVDGSEGSRRAAYYARDLALQTGARLTLLVVIRPPSTVALPPFDAFSMTRAQPDPEHLAAARVLLDEVEAALPADKRGSLVALGQDVAETIDEEARKAGADLVVCGARGLGAAERFVLGSVSEALVRQGGRPVLVVH